MQISPNILKRELFSGTVLHLILSVLSSLRKGCGKMVQSFKTELCLCIFSFGSAGIRNKVGFYYFLFLLALQHQHRQAM